MHCRQEHEEGEASAVSNLYRGRPLIFRDHGERESIVFYRCGRIPCPDMLFECRSSWLFVDIDSATRPASMMAARGASPIRIKTWLRHTRVSSSERYFEQVRFSDTGKKMEGIFGDIL